MNKDIQAFTTPFDYWGNQYSTFTVIGKTCEEILEALKAVTPDNACYGNAVQHENNVVTFDMFKCDATYFARLLSKELNTIVYGGTDWDEHIIVGFDRGEIFLSSRGVNSDYCSVSWLNNEAPEGYYEDEDNHDNDEDFDKILYDIDFIVTDKTSGFDITCGGGMCNHGDFTYYSSLIELYELDINRKNAKNNQKG